MEALNVYPPAAVVKVGDTPIDVEDGCNAGCWSIGVIDSSNEMGLNESELGTPLPVSERETRRNRIRDRFFEAGAHASLNALTELPDLIDHLNSRLRNRERP